MQNVRRASKFWACYVMFHCLTTVSSFEVKMFLLGLKRWLCRKKANTCCSYLGLGFCSQHPFQAAYHSSRSRVHPPLLATLGRRHQAVVSPQCGHWQQNLGPLWEQHMLSIPKVSLQLHSEKYFKCSNYDARILWFLLFLQKEVILAEIEGNALQFPWWFWSHD